MRSAKFRPDKWLIYSGDIFGDQVTSIVILDRLLHHSTTLNIKRESYRLKDKCRAGLVTTPTKKEEEATHAPDPVAMSSD